MFRTLKKTPPQLPSASVHNSVKNLIKLIRVSSSINRTSELEPLSLVFIQDGQTIVMPDFNIYTLLKANQPTIDRSIIEAYVRDFRSIVPSCALQKRSKHSFLLLGFGDSISVDAFHTGIACRSICSIIFLAEYSVLQQPSILYDWVRPAHPWASPLSMATCLPSVGQCKTSANVGH